MTREAKKSAPPALESPALCRADREKPSLSARSVSNVPRLGA